MNPPFLKDLAAKTHRGLRGRVEKGKAGGGLCYGYDVVKRTDSEGDPTRGKIGKRLTKAAADTPDVNIAEHYCARVIRLAETMVAKTCERGR